MIASAIIFPVLHACGAGDSGRSGVTVRDSAGIRIVESDPSAGAAPCELAATPAIEIGVVEGPPEYQLYRVSDASRLPDGRIAVVNAGSQEVRVYDQDGRFLDAFGREGDGPGEFRSPRWIWQRADSLVVYDARQQRFAWFTADGRFVRDVALRPRYLNPPRLFLLRDGKALATDHALGVPPSGFREQPLYLILHGPDGEAADTIGRFSFGRLGPVGPPDARILSGPVFDARTHIAASSDRIYAGRGIEREIEALRPDGTLETLIRWSGADRNVTEEDVERFREREVAEAGTPSERAMRFRVLEDRPVADRFPALDAIHVSRSGGLWVREYHRPTWDEHQRWSIFDENGALACRTRLPERSEILEIGADYVLVAWRDAFDVEHVRLYEIPGNWL